MKIKITRRTETGTVLSVGIADSPLEIRSYQFDDRACFATLSDGTSAAISVPEGPTWTTTIEPMDEEQP